MVVHRGASAVVHSAHVQLHSGSSAMAESESTVSDEDMVYHRTTVFKEDLRRAGWQPWPWNKTALDNIRLFFEARPEKGSKNRGSFAKKLEKRQKK